MKSTVLPVAPEESELARWAEKGFRREPSHSNIVYFGSPDERYTLRAEVDNPVHGYLIELHAADRDDDNPLGRTIVDDRELALDVAAEMAAAADDLHTLADRPRLGPETVHQEDIEQSTLDTPDEWDDEDEWQEAVEEAFEKAEIRRSKGNLTTKTIDGRDYYYLQWREGDKVKSQYVGPISPA